MLTRYCVVGGGCELELFDELGRTVMLPRYARWAVRRWVRARFGSAVRRGRGVPSQESGENVGLGQASRSAGVLTSTNAVFEPIMSELSVCMAQYRAIV